MEREVITGGGVRLMSEQVGGRRSARGRRGDHVRLSGSVLFLFPTHYPHKPAHSKHWETHPEWFYFEVWTSSCGRLQSHIVCVDVFFSRPSLSGFDLSSKVITTCFSWSWPDKVCDSRRNQDLKPEKSRLVILNCIRVLWPHSWRSSKDLKSNLNYLQDAEVFCHCC